MTGKSLACRGATALLFLSLSGLVRSGKGDSLPSATGREDGPPKKDAAKLAPGLHLTFQSLVKGGGADARPARLVALYVPAGTPPTPFLPAGPFRALWKGELTLELKETYAFSAAGRGTLAVLVNGTPAFAAKGDDLAKAPGKVATLKRGANALEVRYESPAKGDAELRLLWGGEEFRREPVGLTALQHDPGALALREGRQHREGRELLAQLRCLHCHKADTAGWVKAGGLPELEGDAPSLADAGARLHADWMARWVQDPAALRPGATMPRMFPDAPRGLKVKLDVRARDVAAYLATLGKVDAKAEPAPKKETVQEGTRLFAHLGCVACHVAPDRADYVGDEHARIPLRDVGAKWRPVALRAFLRQPDRHYAWVRMPNFNLTALEAERLAAYLLALAKRDLAGPGLPAPDVERGRRLVQSAGCVNCHALTATKTTAPHPTAPAFAKLGKPGWARGCMKAKPVPGQKAPAYDLSAAQRAALLDVATSGREALARETAPEFAERQLKALRCNACHKRDGQEDVWTQLKEEADGLLADLPEVPGDKDNYPADQTRPTLTWAGEKLKPEWTALLLAGKLPDKPRPYLRARMPAFPRRADLLARGLAFEHGVPPKSAAERVPDAKLAEVGRGLASKAKWGCVACHNVGSAEAVGVFEAPGPNFTLVKERMRREYFDRWMWAPTRVEPGTKMPTVYAWGKPSTLDDVLGGDAGKQIDALWAYLQTGRKIKAPSGP